MGGLGPKFPLFPLQGAGSGGGAPAMEQSQEGA